ncbi:MAG: F0F1 ATP synthase subunit delta [Spirochaetaceae bacterium]|jgi:F-type H+-transporting ATPase subunit delta|nr:F0F1 ATP synthase subunit delta [Spirochaetaceae bacterium]
MFAAKLWAGAFIGALEDGAPGDAEEGLAALRVFASWAGELPGAVMGSGSAAQMDRLIHGAIAAAGGQFSGRATETAARLIVLLTKKNLLRHAGSVAEAAELILDRKKGIVTAIAECAFPPEDDLREALRAGVRRRTGAADVKLDVRVVPELLGGFRLRIGGDCIDASLRTQMRNLTEELSAGISERASLTASFGGS